MKKIFAFDIDGTLMPEGKKITKNTIKAIDVINQNGDIALLATGRSLSQTKEIAKILKIKKYLITTAGAMITNIQTNKDEILSKVPLNIFNYFMQLCTKHKRQLNIKLKDGAVKYYFGSSPKEDISGDSLFWKKGGTLNPTYNLISNFYNDVNLEEVLQVSMKAEPELVNSLYEQVKKDIESLDENFTVIIVSDVYLELADKRWNKATALDKIRQEENISMENVYVFGDSNNDIEMMKFFPNSIAMGNSTKEILEISSKTIDSCENDGVAKFISNFYSVEINEKEENNQKLFVFDLDGTLIQDNEVISDKVVEAIKIIKDNGDIPIIATGRSLPRSKKVLEKLNLDTFIINCSGATTYNISKQEGKPNAKIPKEISKYFISLAKEINRLLIIKFVDKEIRYYFGDDIYKEIDKDSLFWTRGDLSADSIMDISNFDLDVNLDEITHLAIKAEPELIEKIYIESKDKISEIDDSFSTQIVSDVFLDLKNNNCNKATAIEDLRNELNIDSENVYVFGDSSNDIEMISFFKNGIAMGNATDDVKKIASKVIGKCEEDGVHEFIITLY